MSENSGVDAVVDLFGTLRVEPEASSLSKLSLVKAPRPYQAELISTVLERLALPVSHAPSSEPAARRALVYLPTGGGKTLIAAGVIFDALRRGGRCLFVVNKELLREQALHSLVELGLPEASVGRIGARGLSDAPDAPVQVAMIQTLAKALPSGEATEAEAEAEAKAEAKADAEAGCGLGLELGYDLVVLDEAHAANASTYLRLLGALPRATRLLGLTATPFRSKPCETLAQVFPPRGFVRGPPIAALVAARHLVRPASAHSQPHHAARPKLRARQPTQPLARAHAHARTHARVRSLRPPSPGDASRLCSARASEWRQGGRQRAARRGHRHVDAARGGCAHRRLLRQRRCLTRAGCAATRCGRAGGAHGRDHACRRAEARTVANARACTPAPAPAPALALAPALAPASAPAQA